MSSIETSQTQPINEYAIIVDPKDNVAVVKTETHPALEVILPYRLFNEDEVRQAAALKRGLEAEGFAVDVAGPRSYPP